MTTRTVQILVDEPPRVVAVEVENSDEQVAARYLTRVRTLAEGTISPDRFQAEVETWPPVGGFRLLADPQTVLALLEQQRAGE
jgi:hypothetical protein